MSLCMSVVLSLDRFVVEAGSVEGDTTGDESKWRSACACIPGAMATV